jgi:hypothetical protein
MSLCTPLARIFETSLYASPSLVFIYLVHNLYFRLIFDSVFLLSGMVCFGSCFLFPVWFTIFFGIVCSIEFSKMFLNLHHCPSTFIYTITKLFVPV